jgi:hypothetical protein
MPSPKGEITPSNTLLAHFFRWNLARLEILKHMAHLGWIFPVAGVIGGYIGGILTMLYGPVGKYSFDKANELKELIVEIRRSTSDLRWPTLDFANHPLFDPHAREVFSGYASDLKSKLQLIQGYDLIRCLRLVQLPPKTNIYKAAELLPQFARAIQEGWGNGSILSPHFGTSKREEGHFIAKKIIDLLA